MDNGSNNGYYRLGNIAKIVNGSTPPTQKSEFWKNEIPFLTPNNIENNNYDRMISKKFNKIKRKGTVLISTTATIGNIGILKQDSWFNQQITSIEGNRKNILDLYLYYYFLSKKMKLKNIAGSGSIFTILPIVTFKNWKIFIPSLIEQQKIIDIIEPIEKLEHTFNKLNNIISNLEAFLFNSIYKSSNHITINKLITISNVKVNSNELELRGVGYSGFVNKSNVNRSKLSKQILEDDFVIGLISKNIPIAFNWQENKIGVSTAYYVFKPINNSMASWYIYYYLKNKNWKQFVKPTSRHGQAFEVNLFLNNTVRFVFDDYLEKRFNFIFEKTKCLKNKYDFLLNKIINVKQKLIKILII